MVRRHTEYATRRRTMQSIVGARIGKLVVTGYVDGGSGKRVYLHCDCGRDIELSKSALYGRNPRLTCQQCETTQQYKERQLEDSRIRPPHHNNTGAIK